MQSYYKLLPTNADYVAIASIARDCIARMRNGAKRYHDIVEEINAVLSELYDGGGSRISEASLRTFMNRDYIQRIHSNNITLQVIYDFLRHKYETFDNDIKSVIIAKWDIFTARSLRDTESEDKARLDTVRSLCALFSKWALVNERDVERLAEKICNEYILVRKSYLDEELIVKSILTISFDQEAKILFARLIHTDQHAVGRTSLGFVLPVVRNIYCLMPIEEGEGLDIIALKIPIQHDFEKMLGFQITMNTDRKLISARVFVERNNEEWAEAPARFYLKDIDKYPSIKELILKKVPLLDDKTAPTIPDIPLTDIMLFR
jgi:hypothetical protein